MKLFTDFAYLQSKNTKTPAERMEAVLQMRTLQREKTRGCVISVQRLKMRERYDIYAKTNEEMR